MTTVSCSQRKCTGLMIVGLFDIHVCFLRCCNCLTKIYCSRECLEKDNEEKHGKFCHKDAEERKVKGGAKARVEDGLRHLEVGLEETLKLESAQSFKNDVVEVKELCEKQGGKRKGGNSKKGRGRK